VSKDHKQVERDVCHYLWPESQRDWMALYDLCGPDYDDEPIYVEVKSQAWPRGPRAVWTLLQQAMAQLENACQRSGVSGRLLVVHKPTHCACPDALAYTKVNNAPVVMRLEHFKTVFVEAQPLGGATMATRQVTLDECLEHIATMQIGRRIDEVIIHHTWRPSAGQYQGISTVEGIRRYHMDARGWSDSGYHLAVAPNRELFLCRPMQRSGAHCKYHNAHSIGLSYIANFDAQEPETFGGLETGAQVVAALLRRFDLGVQQANFHRDFANKSCPGNKLDLGYYRRLVASALSDDAALKFVMVILPGSNHAFDCVARSPEAMAALRELTDPEMILNHLDEDRKAYLRRRPD